MHVLYLIPAMLAVSAIRAAYARKASPVSRPMPRVVNRAGY